MTKQQVALASVLALVLAAPFFADINIDAQQPATPAAPAGGARQGGARGPAQPMSFFVTSVGLEKGGDLGGLAGADTHCNALAKAAGSTKTFHAYLSTQGPNAVNARDRIGSGPWYNANGTLIANNVADLHGDTIEAARIGPNISKATALTEKKEVKHSFGEMPLEHDILTGTQPDGRAYTDAADHTCSSWTSATSTGRAQLGHFDRTGGNNISWNSVHGSRGCTQADLLPTGGIGLLYCFAVD